MYEPQSTEPTDEFTLLKVIADIRQKTRIGDKVMLADLADTLAGLIQNGEKPKRDKNSYTPAEIEKMSLQEFMIAFKDTVTN
jgi:hypothetical protein